MISQKNRIFKIYGLLSEKCFILQQILYFSKLRIFAESKTQNKLCIL